MLNRTLNGSSHLSPWSWWQQAPMRGRQNCYHTTHCNNPEDSHFQFRKSSSLTVWNQDSHPHTGLTKSKLYEGLRFHWPLANRLRSEFNFGYMCLHLILFACFHDNLRVWILQWLPQAVLLNFKMFRDILFSQYYLLSDHNNPDFLKKLNSESEKGWRTIRKHHLIYAVGSHESRIVIPIYKYEIFKIYLQPIAV